MIRVTDKFWDSTPVLAEELEAFENRLKEEFGGDSFIEAAARDLIASGGKRLRPAMTIAAANLGEYDREKALPVAMAIEAIHTATLLHDDVIDHADIRRGEAAMHAKHGNHMAIYTGDFLLARGLRQIARSGLQIGEMARIAEAVEQICKGEVSQYLGRNRLPGYHRYLRQIMSKTGMLFAASACAGGYCSSLPQPLVRRLWHLGMRFGAAFQIRDDLIDLDETRQIAGKPTGHDLMEGIITLPILFAAADADYRNLLNSFLCGSRKKEQVRELIRLSRQLGALDQTRKVLDRQIGHCRQLIAELPDNEGRLMLQKILELLVL